MIYVDTNVILDILQRDPTWFDWSLSMLERARAGDRVVTGHVVAAEIAHYLPSAPALARTFEALLVEVVEPDLEAAFRGGQAFREYRRRGGSRATLLPDFLVGGHATALGASILTRDARRFRSYFPDVILLTPETDDG